MIIGNHVGVDRDGSAPLPNQMHGINIKDSANNNLIGGELGKEGNLVGGNLSAGIMLDNVSGTVIRGNVIGLNKNLNDVIGNATCGIVLHAASGAEIGSDEWQYRNIIGGNVLGIDIWNNSSKNVIIGNEIGFRDFSGNLESGLWIRDGSRDNRIGPGNIISFNKSSGIEIDLEETLRNNITANSIFSNNGNALAFTGSTDWGDSAPEIINLTSRSIAGSGAPGTVVEIFSDLTSEARFYEGSALVNEQGIFQFTLSSGSFEGQNIRVLSIDAGGNTSPLCEPIPNPGYGVMRELPNIPSPQQVSKDPVLLGTNFILALASVIFFGFTTTVFNDLVKQYQPGIRSAWKKIVPISLAKTLERLKAAEFGSQAGSRWRFLGMWFAIVMVNAVVESFLDPAVGFLDAARFRSIAGLLAAGLVISGLEWLSDLWVHRRLCDQPHARGELRWFGLLAALASVLFSRIVGFRPGYILGTMGTIILMPKLSGRDESGKRAAIVLSSIFLGALLLWLGSSILPTGLAWMEALFLNIFTIGLQGVLFELVPLEVCDGSELWKWKKWAWFVLFLIVFFGFMHIFLNPTGQDVQALQQNGVQVLLAVMAIYGLATLALWIAFKRKSRHFSNLVVDR